MKIIQTTSASAAIGPYSQAIQMGNMIFSSGQIGIDPTTGTMVSGGIEPQTRRVFANLRAILESAGTSLSSVVKVTVFLKDMNDFRRLNDIYAEEFGNHKPARSTVQVARLPLDADVEIEVVAIFG